MNIYKRRFINYWNGRKTSPTPLHFVNNGSSNATIGWYTKTDDPKTIKYSTDNENWTSISSTGDMATLAPNEVLYVKGTNSSYGYTTALEGSHFTMSGGEISVEGNIMSLINKDNFSKLNTLTTPGTFSGMFKDCTSLRYADKLELPATTLAEYCYYGMFAGCTSLFYTPLLPATILAQNCYRSMFNGCTSLTIAPELPATVLQSNCYRSMFEGCTLLHLVVLSATDISASDCLTNWLNNVAATGTLYYDKNSITLQVDSGSGIPVGWGTIQYPLVSLTFEQNGINYNDVLDPVVTFGARPFGLKDNYTVSETEVESIYSQEIFNIIDMNWNGAELTDLSDNSQTIRISTTTDLLNYLKTLNNNINNLSIS